MSESKHPFQGIAMPKKAVAEEIEQHKASASTQFRNCINNYLDNNDSCYDFDYKRQLKCNCCQKLVNNKNLDSICNLIGEMHAATPELRKECLSSVIGRSHALTQNEKSWQRTHFLPMSSEKDLAFCKHGIRLIFDAGRRKCAAIIDNCGLSHKQQHVLKGSKQNKNNSLEIKKVLINHMQELANKEGESHAIRFMREHHKMCLRDSEVKTIELPSSCTKHKIYKLYCCDDGCIATNDVRGVVTLTERPCDEEFTSDTERVRVASWGGFHSTWNAELPHIRIRPPLQDACDQCYE